MQIPHDTGTGSGVRSLSALRLIIGRDWPLRRVGKFIFTGCPNCARRDSLGGWGQPICGTCFALFTVQCYQTFCFRQQIFLTNTFRVLSTCRTVILVPNFSANNTIRQVKFVLNSQHQQNIQILLYISIYYSYSCYTYLVGSL